MSKSVYKTVDLHFKTNNFIHHTSEISLKELIVRRGHPFTITITLTEPFNGEENPLFLQITTGDIPSEEKGTMSVASIPEGVDRSPEAKAVWMVKLEGNKSSPHTGVLVVNFTPPSDAPIGQYCIVANYKDQETLLGVLVVLFNPWWVDDMVFLMEEDLIQEYVMNEHGKIYRGSADSMMDMDWDFGQFEENMVKICLRLLDYSLEHMKDPAEDVANRADPNYVGRVLSAMINSEDDHGVLEGQWGGDYSDGHRPSHWTGSSAILTKWLDSGCMPVKYGQCWVFAGVMCTVMRFLGIPCRVISNFNSAHDANANLTIDRYHDEDGLIWDLSDDSVWNFHVWVEGWMKRPNLSPPGTFSGWQVLDPTPQELSGGVYCCGPASKEAILNGFTDVEYDVPFVYAEVNADIVDWLVDENGALEKIESDISHVGQNISTKGVGTDDRFDVTATYKHQEGSTWERMVFSNAIIRHYSNLQEIRERELQEKKEREEALLTGGGASEPATTPGDETVNGGSGTTPAQPSGTTTPQPAGEGGETPEPTPGPEMPNGGVITTNDNESPSIPVTIPPPPKVSLRFEQMSNLVNGKDVILNLVLSSESKADRPLLITISAQAMTYSGHPVGVIQKEKKEETLMPGKDLTIPIVVPSSAYAKLMLDSDSMKISALVKDKVNPDHPYLREHNVVLSDPPLEVKIFGDAQLSTLVQAEVAFLNPGQETLTNCSMTISGSGLQRGELQVPLGDLKPSRRIRVQFPIIPYKQGVRTLIADFDCSQFRDVKGSCNVTVK